MSIRCPEQYYDNCHNAMKSCKFCRAGESRIGKLHYSPIDTSLIPHPCEIDPKKQKILRQAKKVEKNIESSIARQTIRSGARDGDGDIHLLDGEYRMEAKDRGKRSSWNVTWQEYQKGKQQSIDVFAISIICPDGKRREMYCLDQKLFTDLLALIKKAHGKESN